MWIEHGGSGLGMSYSEVNELDFAEIPELLRLLRAQRKRESDAIRNASRKR